MKNLEIARAFDLIADLLELKGENPFRIRAYRRAAQNLRTMTASTTSRLVPRSLMPSTTRSWPARRREASWRWRAGSACRS